MSGEVLTADKMDTHNIPGQQPNLVPASYTGGKLGEGRLKLDIPAKSVVVIRLD